MQEVLSEIKRLVEQHDSIRERMHDVKEMISAMGNKKDVEILRDHFKGLLDEFAVHESAEESFIRTFPVIKKFYSVKDVETLYLTKKKADDCVRDFFEIVSHASGTIMMSALLSHHMVKWMSSMKEHMDLEDNIWKVFVESWKTTVLC